MRSAPSSRCTTLASRASFRAETLSSRSTPAIPSRCWSGESRAEPRPSDRVLLRLALNHRPVDVGELLEGGVAPEPSPATLLHPAERHLRFIVDRRVVHVADPGLDPLCDVEGRRDVAAEHRTREAVIGVVRGPDRVLDVLVFEDRHDRAEGLLLV